jgi:hypothetical protein
MDSVHLIYENNIFLIFSSFKISFMNWVDSCFSSGHYKRGGMDTASIVAYAKGFARTAPVLVFEDREDLLHRTMAFRALTGLHSSVGSLREPLLELSFTVLRRS